MILQCNILQVVIVLLFLIEYTDKSTGGLTVRHDIDNDLKVNTVMQFFMSVDEHLHVGIK